MTRFTARRTAAASILAALTLSLTACGGSNTPRTTDEPVTPAPSAGSSAARGPGAPGAPGVTTSAPVVSFAPDSEAVASFGEQRVREALAIAQTLALAATANADLLDADRDSADDIVRAVDTYLTGEARTRLADAASNIPTDATQADNVSVQLVTAAYAAGDLIPVAPYIAAWEASGYEVSLDEDGRLGVDFTVTSDVLYERAGKPVTYPVERKMYYAMVPSPEGTDGPSWLVDDWASTTTVGDPR